VIVTERVEDLAPLERPLAMTPGVFDGCHLGHRAVLGLLLREAAKLDAAPVFVTFDPHPLEILRPDDAPSLLTTREERIHLLAQSSPAAILVHAFHRETAALTPVEFLRAIVPPSSHLALLVVGYDFRMGRDRSGGFEELLELGRERGFRVLRAEPVVLNGEPVSSTRIRALVQEGQVRAAAELLGHRYLIQGKVVRGRGIGRTLDYPTANVDVPDGRKLLPLPGVYAVLATVLEEEEALRPGVMNIGTRPTFGLTEMKIEVHFPGFEGDLTGRTLRIELVDRIRDEKRFPGPEELRQRIALDVEVARKILQGVT
jgi:riboflavin kinase/FMN adenylyltransferase